jgi:hypothetical protein
MDIGEMIAAKVKSWPMRKQRLLARIVEELDPVETMGRMPVRGLWAGLSPDISDDEIAEMRREMWGAFPREDT